MKRVTSMRMVQTSLPTLLLALLTCAGCSKTPPVDRVIHVEEDDAEMQAAIATARSTLPEFWKTFENPTQGETDFALKLPVTDANGTEHFWLTSIEKKNGKIFGTVNNDPETVKSVRDGQRIEVPEAEISDWMFFRDGKMVGNATVRPLMKKMSADELKQVKSLLGEP